MGRLRNMFKWAEVKEREDIYTWRGTTEWGNHDIYPTDPKDRTFGFMAYASFWAQSGSCISTYTIGSSYIAIGLSQGETIGAIFLGALMSSIVGVFAARPGTDYGIGYTIFNRMAFGLRGSYLAIFVIFITGMIFSGLQAFYGGQAITLMLGAIFPSFKFMENTLPASAAITTQDLIGFIIYTVIYFPVVYYIKPPVLRLALYPSFVLTMSTFTGMLIWALVSNGGTGPSTVLAASMQLTKSQRALRFIQCVSGVSGTWGGAAERFSDWSRYEKKRYRSVPGLFVLPIVVTLCGVFGVLTTTATANMYGVVEWNPVLLLGHVQEMSYTPGCRAATFFAGFAIYYCQIFMNLSQNSIPFGMDVSAAFPRYFTIQRATFALVIITLAIQPWRFLSQALIFITILSSVTVYFACATAIVLTDYWIIRKKLFKVPDLYTVGGIYWFYKGWNLRCITALVLGMIPSLPGFFMVCIDSSTDNPAVNIFQVCWFVGAPLSFIIYYALNYFWPPAGLGVKELISPETEAIEVIEGVGSGSEDGTNEKTAAEVTEKSSL